MRENMSSLNLSFGLVLGLVIIGLTWAADDEFTKGRLKEWSNSERVSSSSSSSSAAASSSSSSSADGGYRVRRSAIEDKALLWPNAEVPYVISDEIDRVVKRRILEAIEHYHETTCIRFINGTAEEHDRNRTMGNVDRNYVRFTLGKEKTLCSSPVGMTLGSRPLRITLGILCTLADIVHEIGHLLGLMHEQSRADRDANVIIQWNDIISDRKGNFDKSDSTKWLGPYDLTSVMHYTPQTFSTGENSVFTPIHDLAVKPINRIRLSFYDAFKLNKLYQCANHCDTIKTSCENGGYLNQNCQCVCPKSLTGTRCEAPITSKDCGKIIELKETTKRTITSLNFPKKYPPNISCTWLIKAPVGHQILMALDRFDISCKDTMEIRYHYIGIELKARSCVNSSKVVVGGRSVTSTTNRMIINFESNSGNDERRSGFRAAVKAVPSQNCASSPCHKNATCRDVPEIETYFCQCPDRWIGKDCELQVKDGEWSAWSSWSGCTAQCGYEDRRRDCDTPPINGGRDCEGVRKETRKCSEEEGQCLFRCDFGVESNHVTCGIVQESLTDDFDWRTQSQHHKHGYGSQRLAGHTTRDPDDVFFHMDGSDGEPYQSAIFWLPRGLASTGRYCLQFFYHMSGRWMGMLNVVRVTRRSSRVIWQASGNHSNAWHRANVNVLLYDEVKIGFFGVRGDGADCDIAVDDVSLSETGCYVTHFGRKVLRVPRTHRRQHESCHRGEHRFRVGNVSFVEGCREYTCHCNHDGKLDCPSWHTKDICTKSITTL